MLIELTGTLPLLVHSEQLADDHNPIKKQIKLLTDKKTNKTDDDKDLIDKLSFVGALYYDDVLGPYLPAKNLFKSLMEAGAMTREGKKIERGLFILTTQAALEYDGPRDPEALWGVNGETKFVDRRTVVVTGKRISRVRPIFPTWSCTFEAETDPDILDDESFDRILTKAGRYAHVGTFRRFYGAFTATVAR